MSPALPVVPPFTRVILIRVRSDETSNIPLPLPSRITEPLSLAMMTIDFSILSPLTV